MMRAGPNRDYYLKKRDQGRTHSQAVIALVRRRIDVLWALLRETAPGPPPHQQGLKPLDNNIEIPSGRERLGRRPRPGAG